MTATTALVAVGSSVLGGALGGLLTTLLRGRIERDAQLRATSRQVVYEVERVILA
jgi:hypothetical protein